MISAQERPRIMSCLTRRFCHITAGLFVYPGPIYISCFSFLYNSISLKAPCQLQQWLSRNKYGYNAVIYCFKHETNLPCLTPLIINWCFGLEGQLKETISDHPVQVNGHLSKQCCPVVPPQQQNLINIPRHNVCHIFEHWHAFIENSL